MDERAAFAIANASPPPHFERFYGPVADAAIGAGMILSNVQYPTFDTEVGRFRIVSGLVLILTHECDLDQANERVFNGSAVICPIIPLGSLAGSLSGVMTDDEARGWISNVSARNVNRLIYIPIIPSVLPLGGYLYLNLIGSTHLSLLSLEGVEQICMLSAEGLREVDLALERHFRRPKADRLPFQNEMVFGRG